MGEDGSTTLDHMVLPSKLYQELQDIALELAQFFLAK
jgi:hypothetical protein